jgi:hypothetical protein
MIRINKEDQDVIKTSILLIDILITIHKQPLVTEDLSSIRYDEYNYFFTYINDLTRHNNKGSLYTTIMLDSARRIYVDINSFIIK